MGGRRRTTFAKIQQALVGNVVLGTKYSAASRSGKFAIRSVARKCLHAISGGEAEDLLQDLAQEKAAGTWAQYASTRACVSVFRELCNSELGRSDCCNTAAKRAVLSAILKVNKKATYEYLVDDEDGLGLDLSKRMYTDTRKAKIAKKRGQNVVHIAK